MDLLGDAPVLRLNEEEWRIYSRHEPHAPQFVGADAVIENSSLTEGCEIYGTVRNSVLGSGVCVMAGAEVCDAVIMENVVIKEGACVRYSIIDHDAVIGAKATIGKAREEATGITVVGAGIVIPEGRTIGDDKMLSNQSDVEKEEA